ncbi:MAG: class I SAM-dependent methyltransferase [Victivallaceae bacterium]|jgi:ubiquinone/menaquinone biosynthesis C-methylase UbiE
MKKNVSSGHDREIIDQFTKQAEPFAKLAGHADSMNLLAAIAAVNRHDKVLDVACGPGLVACFFAEHAGHVTGIDITEAMIAAAEKRQQEHGLTNMSWNVGDACPLPYDGGAFSIVITRYSFHHFLNPETVLREMIRVCKPGGTVMAADVAIAPECAGYYDGMEKLRDPSHVRALTVMEFMAMFQHSGLTGLRQESYSVEMELEAQLAASFPPPGGKDKLRAMFKSDIGRNRMGVRAETRDGKIYYCYPITVLAGKKQQ